MRVLLVGLFVLPAGLPAQEPVPDSDRALVRVGVAERALLRPRRVSQGRQLPDAVTILQAASRSPSAPPMAPALIR